MPSEYSLSGDNQHLTCNSGHQNSKKVDFQYTICEKRRGDCMEGEDVRSLMVKPALNRLITEYPSDGDAVICKIREHEESIQAPDGKFGQGMSAGVEIIVDEIDGTRIVSSSNQIDATTLKENTIKLREIQPRSTHRTEYAAEHGPLLSIKEVLDTEPTRDEVPSLSLPYTSEPHAIKLTIEIENLGSEPLSDIDISREIPPWELKPGLTTQSWMIC